MKNYAVQSTSTHYLIAIEQTSLVQEPAILEQDGQPIAVFCSIFPAGRFPQLPAALQQEQSVTRALALNGIPDYVRASTRITATAASAIQALHLHLSEGAPLLRSVAINTDTDGRPVEYGTTWFAGDRVTLAVAGNDDE